MEEGDYSIGEHPWIKEYITYQWCLLPKVCFFTGKELWFKKAIRHRLSVQDEWPGSAKFTDRWYDSKEYTVRQLRDEIGRMA